MNILRKGEKFSVEELVDFIQGCRNVYIYGAGKIASRLAETLKKANVDWTGFIVTDNPDDNKEFMGRPLYALNEVSMQESDGVILGVVERNHYQLEEKLKEINSPAKIYAQKLFGRKVFVPDNYVMPADKNSGFFARFQELNSYGELFDTDKSHKYHDYLRKYELFLQYWKDKAFTLLELGVYHGGSISTWGGVYASRKGYFEKARVVGVDINPQCKEYVHGQEVLIKDLGDKEQLSELTRLHPSIIVDDASHFCAHQIMALFVLWESIPSGGIYIMEDIETSFSSLGFVGFDDAVISAYDVCQAIAEGVASGTSLRNDIALQEEIERIAKEVDMISFVRGSCIIVKK